MTLDLFSIFCWLSCLCYVLLNGTAVVKLLVSLYDFLSFWLIWMILNRIFTCRYSELTNFCCNYVLYGHTWLHHRGKFRFKNMTMFPGQPSFYCLEKVKNVVGQLHLQNNWTCFLNGNSFHVVSLQNQLSSGAKMQRYTKIFSMELLVMTNENIVMFCSLSSADTCIMSKTIT